MIFVASLKKASGLIKDLGVVDGLLYGCDRVLREVSAARIRLFKYYLVAQPVAGTPWLPPGKPAAVSFKLVDANDPSIEAFPRPAGAIRARYAQKGNCLAAYKSGEFVGYIWFNYGVYREDEVRCSFLPLPKGQASWDYDIYIDPRYRLGRLFVRLWDELNARLRHAGVRWTVSRISAFNMESRMSHGRLGATIIGSAAFLCVGRAQVYLGSVKPYLHLSASGDGPLIELDTTNLDKP